MKHCYVIIILFVLLCICSGKEDKQEKIDKQTAENNSANYTPPINPVEAIYKRNESISYRFIIKTTVKNIGGEIPLIISSKLLIKPSIYSKNKIFEVLIEDFEGYVFKDNKRYSISKYRRFVNKTLYIYLNKDYTLGKVKRKNKYSPVIKDIGIRIEDLIKLSFILCSREKKVFKYQYNVSHFFNRLKVDIKFIIDTVCRIEGRKKCFYQIDAGGFAMLDNKDEKREQENKIEGMSCLNDESIICNSEVSFIYSLKTRLGMKNIGIDREYTLQLKLLED